MKIEPGVYWYQGPLFRDGHLIDRTGWEVVEIEDVGNGELVIGMICDTVLGGSVDVARMARLGHFVLINPPGNSSAR